MKSKPYFSSAKAATLVVPNISSSEQFGEVGEGGAGEALSEATLSLLALSAGIRLTRALPRSSLEVKEEEN